MARIWWLAVIPAVLLLAGATSSPTSSLISSRAAWRPGEEVFVSMEGTSWQRGPKAREIKLTASLATGNVVLRTHYVPKSEMHMRLPRQWREPSVALGRFVAGDLDIPLALETYEEEGALVSKAEDKLHFKIAQDAQPVVMKRDADVAAWFKKQFVLQLMQFPRLDPPDESTEPVVAWYLMEGSPSAAPLGVAPALEIMLVCDRQVLGSSLAYGVTDRPWSELPSSARPCVIWRGNLKPLLAAKRITLHVQASEAAARRSVTHNEFADFEVDVDAESIGLIEMDKGLVRPD